MSTKCFTCKEPIINADFIKCEGTCAEKFHSKCVALNKATLNAITSCPNVHWFCHECNNGTKAIGTSIDNMRNAVEGLTNSMSSDLLNGFKMLTNTLASSLSSIHRSSLNFGADTGSSMKRRRNETGNESESEGEPIARKKRFTGSNNSSNGTLIAAEISSKSDEHRRSIVVSNIAKGISADYLTNYLSNELQIDGSNIRTTSLKPARIADDQLRFLQFRVSVPENVYNKVMAPETWPTGVRVRDYVFNSRGVSASVSKDNFLSKRTFHTSKEHPTVQSIADNPTQNTPREDLIQLAAETEMPTTNDHSTN